MSWKSVIRKIYPAAIFIAFLLSSNLVLGQNPPVFLLPVDTPVHLAGTFGELRSAHFHTGLDFRTGGEEGKSVCSAAKGWVSRVKVSTVGFGQVLYIDHPEGYTTVYAHLHHFLGPLAQFVDSAQQAANNYEIELFPDSGRFPLDAGELIGLSGNSGGSEGPHLHFEIRKRADQIPLNPLAFIALSDTVHPLIQELIAYEMKGDRFVQAGVMKLKEMKMLPEMVVTTKSIPDTVAFSALMNDSDPPNVLGIYKAELREEDKPVFGFSFDSLNFDDGRFANAHSVLPRSGSRFHRLHRLSGNKAASFKTSGSGYIVLSDTGYHPCTIEAMDYSGNTAVVQFNLKVRLDTNSYAGYVSYAPLEVKVVYPFDSVNVIYDDHQLARLEVPSGAAYQDYNYSVTLSRSILPALSAAYKLSGNEDVPFHRTAVFRIPLISDSLKGIDSLKLVVIRWDNAGKVREVLRPESFSQEAVTVKVRNTGLYGVEADSIAPVMSGWKLNYDPVDQQNYEQMYFSDDLSGVVNATVRSGGKWVLSVFDPRDKSVKWAIDPSGNGPRQYEIRISDFIGNKAVFKVMD